MIDYHVPNVEDAQLGQIAQRAGQIGQVIVEQIEVFQVDEPIDLVGQAGEFVVAEDEHSQAAGQVDFDVNKKQRKSVVVVVIVWRNTYRCSSPC